MGAFTNGRLTRIAALIATAMVLVLNTVLIAQTFGVEIPGLSGGR
jgi:manganese transport protein